VKREVAEVLRQAEARGWRVRPTRGGHWKLTHPSGAIVVAASTPSDARALKNLTANLRRAELLSPLTMTQG
jgi:predicted RNA binding protein YcfA (HicA-like mRNA interferase family)